MERGKTGWETGLKKCKQSWFLYQTQEQESHDKFLVLHWFNHHWSIVHNFNRHTNTGRDLLQWFLERIKELVFFSLFQVLMIEIFKYMNGVANRLEILSIDRGVGKWGFIWRSSVKGPEVTSCYGLESTAWDSSSGSFRCSICKGAGSISERRVFIGPWMIVEDCRRNYWSGSICGGIGIVYTLGWHPVFGLKM